MALRVMPKAVRELKTDYLLMLVIVAIGVAVFLPKIMATVLINHDDVISVIAATCNQTRYNVSIPTGQWVNASQWQQYWQMGSFGCFEQIRQGLLHYDIHPPFYFWLLHIWFTIFGVSIQSGLILNLVILLVTTVVIYACCRTLSVSSRWSFIGSLAWMLSLFSRMMIGVIRQYALLSLLAALLLLLVIWWLKKGQVRYLVGLCVVLTAGALTHYHFAAPAFFVLVFAAAILVKGREYRKVAQLGVATLIAAVVFYLAHPEFLQSFSRADNQAQSFYFVGFLQRIVSAGGTVLQLFNPLDWSHPLPFGLLDWANPFYIAINALNLLVGGAGIYLAIRMARKALKTRPHSIQSMLTIEFLPIFTAAATWSAVIALYIFFVSPVHAIGLQYLHFATPGLFIGLAQAAEVNRDAVPRRVAAALPRVLMVCAVLATALFVFHRPEQQRIQEIRNAGAVIMDSDQIGILPTVLWHASPATKVYAATGQDQLLTNFPDPTKVTAGPFHYVSSLAYGNTAQKRDELLKSLTKLGRGGGVPQAISVVYLVPLGGDVYAFGH